MIQNLQINIWYTQYSFRWDLIIIQRYRKFGRIAPGDFSKNIFSNLWLFSFFLFHFAFYNTINVAALGHHMQCTHILHKGEVCNMIFPFPFESKVDFKYWLRSTLREDILKPDRQRSAYISFDRGGVFGAQIPLILLPKCFALKIQMWFLVPFFSFHVLRIMEGGLFWP